MSEPPKQPEQKRIEMTPEQLRNLLAKPEDKAKVSKHLNRFDKNYAAWRLRDTQTEVYQQRGVNLQQNDQMRGFMKWQGTQHQMAYNLILGITTSLGGIKPAQLAMRQRKWYEEHAPGLIVLGLLVSAWISFIYSPDFRDFVETTFAPLPARITLVVGIIIVAILAWRSRRNKEG